MKSTTDPSASNISLHAHLPERRRRQSAELLSQLNGCCCCCCCCCCLHSLGSLVGAVWASTSANSGLAASPKEAATKLVVDEIDWQPHVQRARMPVKRIYWGTVVAIAVVTGLYGVLVRADLSDPRATLLILAVFLPAVQLGASLVAALVMACFPQRYQDLQSWALLVRITAWSVVGAIIGTLIMVLLGVFLRR